MGDAVLRNGRRRHVTSGRPSVGGTEPEAGDGTWRSAVPDVEACLQATEILATDDPKLRRFLGKVPTGIDCATVASLFRLVRDEISYDFAPVLKDRSDWEVGATIDRGSGFCQQKAVVLAAALRARSIPAALAFEDLWDAKIKPPFSDLLGGQVIPWHGLVLVYLDNRWIRLDGCLDAGLCAAKRYRLAEFDPAVGAPLPTTDLDGQAHFRVVRERYADADLPAEVVEETLAMPVMRDRAWYDLVRARRGSM